MTRHHSSLLAILTSSFLTTCQVPTTEGFSCTEGGTCPDGQRCLDGACISNDSDAGTSPDMAVPEDLAGVDLAGADLASSPPPDFAGGPTAVAGCSGVGYAVGGAYACVGVFSAASPASKLCASGYSVVKDGSKVSLAQCKMLPGFFAGDVLLSRYSANAPNTGTCMMTPLVGQVRQFVGCGKRTSVALTTACAGFDQAVDCTPDPAWDCPANQLDAATNTSAADGVLCAR